MRKVMLGIAALLLCLCAGVYAMPGGTMPPLHDGDLIFQTSGSDQSRAIAMATTSSLTHMGIIKRRGPHIMVVEAADRVKETPLEAWVARGYLRRVAIYRHPALTADKATQVLAAARTYYGRPYDIFFALDNDAIYCSELPFRAYQSVGLNIGEEQSLSELNFDNPFVRRLIAKRWQSHPTCKAKRYTAEQCHAHVLRQKMVTPASIARDGALVKIYSNYPF